MLKLHSTLYILYEMDGWDNSFIFFSQKGWIRVFSAAEVWSSFKYDYLQDVDYTSDVCFQYMYN